MLCLLTDRQTDGQTDGKVISLQRKLRYYVLLVKSLVSSITVDNHCHVTYKTAKIITFLTQESF